MFEARFDQGALLQKLIAALGEVIVDANFDADSSGISVQAMDTSHTCLVSAQIKADALAHFRADRPLTLGLNLPNLVKVLKCAGKDDAIALRAADDAGTLALVCESGDRVSGGCGCGCGCGCVRVCVRAPVLSSSRAATTNARKHHTPPPRTHTPS